MSEQRERLLSAAALAHAQSATPTIATVVKLAGVSRNTFYEYFDDLEHARAAAARRAEHRLSVLLRAAEERTRTPVERWRALASAWMGWATATPAEAGLCLVDPHDGRGAAVRELEAALGRSVGTLRAAGVNDQQVELRIAAVAAVAELFARRMVRSGSHQDDVLLEAERERLERALVDVAVRLLR